MPVTPAVSQEEAEEPIDQVDDYLPQAALACIKQTGVEVATAMSLRSAFAPMFVSARAWLKDATGVRVTDAGQVDEMARAREIRLKLRAVRCDAESTRKRLKADSLAKGKAIDGVAKVIKDQIEPVEAYLLEQEEFTIRAEQKRIDALRGERLALMGPLCDPVAGPSSVDLGTLTAQEWDAMYEGAKMQAQIREATRRREEEERKQEEAKRLAKEKADAAERKRLQEENDRLQAEQRKRDAENAKLKAAAAEAERQRLAKEQSDKAEAAAEAARLAEVERKAASAPDKEKALAFVAVLRALDFPDLVSPAGKSISQSWTASFDQLCDELENQANWRL